MQNFKNKKIKDWLLEVFNFYSEENGRFTAFLRLKERTEDRNSPARQGFDGLLIAPVQRLPRYLMLGFHKISVEFLKKNPPAFLILIQMMNL